MSTRTVELVSEWESVPFEGGYEGLRALAADEFSGAVVSGPTRLFMVGGTVVGILEGDIEDFEGGDGTARRAPHEALPLLAVMQERADEVRAKYYTQDTPLSEVNETLSDGNFTGFVELSENVLSGDYYQVYHGGRSMSVAWVGSADRLVTDDDAFEQADDEVGIYEVKPVDISPVEIPEPAEPDTGGAAAGAVGTAETDDADANEAETEPVASEGESADETAEPIGSGEAVDSDDSVETADQSESPTAADAADDANDDPATERRSGPATGGPPGSKAAGTDQGVAGPDAERRRSSSAAQPTEREQTDGAEATETGESTTDGSTTGSSESSRQSAPETAETTASAERASETNGPASQSSPGGDSAASGPTDPAQPPQTAPKARETAQSPTAASGTGGATTTDLETRSIPSLDPDRSTAASTRAAESAVVSNDVESSAAPQETETTTERSADAASSAARPRATDEQRDRPAADRQRERVEEVESELDAKEAEIGRLRTELDDLSATNDDLRAERDRLQTELDEAKTEIQRLERRLGDAQEDAPDAGTRLSPAEAIDGTNLFVRYHSKGEATLEKAHAGDADRSQVEENLRLEYHTQFDGTDAVVDGEEFETFLQESIHYRFVDWLVRNLLYEIRDTGHASAMRDLYDALPEIDRAELNGNVSVTYTEDGKQHRSQEQFDVVARDRMGNPLVVANINDSRQPATDGQMTDIVRDAERVGNASGSLAAAFLVTSSFFEPGALETAEEATSSGLFSRDKRKSFVNLSRKDGYHLCLLEARNREFHLAVPEL
ncbi:DUF7527 domain-containing protein [Haloarcula nitratireducens]|uniref:DUF7527 domain-containing protein n=1 Tax=Haloarcula nitratireducens TaxID=2487749 RepID=A0AAW4PAP6_9EURY|nr:hypothetical protein [Halomicroarcula nitratireducens]MBX0294658.1 hypothetical protein [Halomicroarcula nitratireducens]